MRRILTLMLSFIAFVFLFSCSSGTSSNNESTENEAGNSTITNEETGTSANEETSGTTETVVNQSRSTDETEPFDYLKKIEIGGDIFIKYNESKSTVYNKPLNELDKTHQMYSDSPFGEELLVKTEIASGEEYYITYSPGPSADPTFIFTKVGDNNASGFSVGALQLYVPANGAIYTAGHTNNMFNTRKKYTLRGGKFEEEPQPFYYVGLKTEPLETIKLYESTQLRNEVASLPEGYDIEVLINKPGTDLFLITTKFGLTGWVKAKNGFNGPPNIKGIYLSGD